MMGKNSFNSKRLFAGFASMLFCLPAIAVVKVSDSNSTSFHFSGIIEASCKANGIADNNAANMALTSANTSQDIGTLQVWCNTDNNASTKYTSANQGYLVDGNNKIAYTLNVGESSGDIDLTNEYINSNTSAGFGSNGDTESHRLSITPQTNGLDSAGQYSDTITVTVAYN
ncbi:MAG: spore coat protein U-like protein [Phenylobacterium sp.]|jgi:spore coat protein U-like protein